MLPALVGRERVFIYSNRVLPRGYVRGEFLRSEEGYRISQIEIADAIEDGRVKFIYIYGTNLLATLPNQGKLRDAILSFDVFIVLHDIFLTDTALFSDVVLPSNTFFERLDIVDSYYHRYVALNEAVVKSRGKGNAEVIRLLARELGVDSPYLYEGDEEIIAKVLQEVGVDYEDLRKRGVVKVPLRGGVERINLAPEFRLPEIRENGMFRLISATYLFTVSSQYHNTLGREDPRAHINPEDAESLGIEENSPVRIWNEHGEIVTRAHLSGRIPRGIVLLYKAFWPSRLGWNVNFIVDDSSPLGYHGVAMHSTLVRARRAD